MKRNTLLILLAFLCVSVGQAAQVFTPGVLKYEYFPGQTRQTVEAGTAGSPAVNPAGIVGSDTSGEVTVFESGINFAESYANRFSGFFVPATTGDYVFFIAADDDSDLFLSTDDTPANKRMIAQEAGWSGSRNYNTVGGTSTVENKRSDSFSPDGGTTIPFAAGIHLVAGTRYYIEGVHHEGGGGDNFIATFKLKADADPADGDPSKLTGNVIGDFVDSAVLAQVLTSQPLSRRVVVGDTPTLRVNAITPDTKFQWYKGSAAIAGATNSAYQLPAITAGDNGAVFYVTATNSVAGVKSSDAVITVGKLVLVAGAKDEVWDAATRDDVENGSLDGTTPFYLNNMLTFETPTNQLKDGADFPFTQRLSAIFVAPVTGDYIFFIAADDDSDLFISTDATPAKKYQIAAEPGWSAVRSYLAVGGGAPVTQKRSDKWVPDPAAPPATPPFADGIHLIAGNKYYIEAVDHEGGGGDNLTATYKLVGEPDPANGSETRLSGFVLDKYVNGLDGGLITITTQPQNTTGVESRTATLTIGATSSYIGDATSASPGVGYQWQAAPAGSSTFTNVPGALSSSYTTPLLKLSDTGTQFRVALLAADATTNSSIATLTVNQDASPPVIVGATAFPGSTKVGLMFDKALEAASAGNAANYKVNGSAVASAVVRTNVANEITNEKNLVQLTVATALTNAFTVTVSGVKDLIGNTIVSATATGKILDLTITDIGSPATEPPDDPAGPDPQAPSTVTTWGPGAFDVLTTGSNDYWNNADGFNFVWAPKTNSFDVKVRVVSVSPINNWSAGAIEVREGPPTANGKGWELARHYFCKVDYGGPDPIPVLDGSGDGADSYEFNCRLIPGDPAVRENANSGAGQSRGWGGAGPGNPSPVPFPNAWIRIARVQNGTNDHLLGYSSSDGVEWDLRQDVDLNDETHAGFLDDNGNPGGKWPSVCYVGLGSTSHTGVGNNNALNEGTVGEFWYSPAGQPYSAYIIYRDFGDFAPTTPPVGPTLAFQVAADGTITLTYTGTLVSSDTANGTYQPVSGATSPFTVKPQAGTKKTTFYQAKQ